MLCGLLFACLAAPVYAQNVPAPTEKQLIALDKIAAPLRKKVVDILLADKTGQYQTYLDEVKKMSKTTDRDELRALAGRLRENHYTFIKNAFTAAKIDLAALKRQYTAALGHGNFTMDEFGGITSHPPIPKDPLPKNFDKELNCPYNVIDDFTNVIGISGCSATLAGCSLGVDVHAISLAAGCRSKASMGDKVELPSGNFTKAVVSAQFDFDYYGVALSVGGYGQYNVKIGLRLTGANLDKVNILHDAWCVAPLVFYNEISKDSENFPAQTTFTGSFSGNITPMVYLENFAIAVGINSTGGFTNANSLDFIRLDASN